MQVVKPSASPAAAPHGMPSQFLWKFYRLRLSPSPSSYLEERESARRGIRHGRRCGDVGRRTTNCSKVDPGNPLELAGEPLADVELGARRTYEHKRYSLAIIFDQTRIAFALSRQANVHGLSSPSLKSGGITRRLHPLASGAMRGSLRVFCD